MEILEIFDIKSKLHSRIKVCPYGHYQDTKESDHF